MSDEDEDRLPENEEERDSMLSRLVSLAPLLTLALGAETGEGPPCVTREAIPETKPLLKASLGNTRARKNLQRSHDIIAPSI
jgi:hypothetical protein